MADININLSDLDFKEVGDEKDPSSKLIATVTLNGVSHHLEAVAVQFDADGDQVGANPTCEMILSDLYVGIGSDMRFKTVQYRGREYVFFMSPST